MAATRDGLPGTPDLVRRFEASQGITDLVLESVRIEVSDEF